jgi:hypothetical protein
LDANALAAAHRFVFEPPALDGQPVSVLVRLVLDFRLY